jgi:enoyl-CoA hydratase
MKYVFCEILNKIAVLTINRQEQLNALSCKVIDELSIKLEELKKDDSVRVLLLTGAGTKSFIAGADIKEFANFTPTQGKELAKIGQEKLFNVVENFPKPIIALINGFALGGGLELALSCHIRIASENAKFGFPEVSLGLIPGYGGTQRLTQLVGKGIAMELILTGKMIDAIHAKNLKVVNEIVIQEELLNKGLEYANQIILNSPKAISSAIKSILNYQKQEGFQNEINYFGELFQTEEFIEGTQAFLEKRKPNF